MESGQPRNNKSEFEEQSFVEPGYFIADRELTRFNSSVPRLMHSTPGITPAVAISRTLFAGQSVLLVLSDGDGSGGVGIQLVDPAKGLTCSACTFGCHHLYRDGSHWNSGVVWVEN